MHVLVANFPYCTSPCHLPIELVESCDQFPQTDLVRFGKQSLSEPVIGIAAPLVM